MEGGIEILKGELGFKGELEIFVEAWRRGGLAESLTDGKGSYEEEGATMGDAGDIIDEDGLIALLLGERCVYLKYLLSILDITDYTIFKYGNFNFVAC